MSPSKTAFRAGLVISARRDGVQAEGVVDGIAKSLPSHLCRQFAAVESIEWIGLHNRQTAEDLARIPHLNLIDVSPWLSDLADTAAVITHLDVVVAVDTAVAHLAGAMGKKVLLMLQKRADWRWGRNRTDTLWYKDVELFRQQHEGDWSDVVAAVARRLAQLRAEPAKTPGAGRKK
jgi:Glycosyltransferase family 9 (heptosyltransferase)